MIVHGLPSIIAVAVIVGMVIGIWIGQWRPALPRRRSFRASPPASVRRRLQVHG